MSFKLLLCAPDLKGGISAVVSGIEKGLENFSNEIVYKKISYARRHDKDPKLNRLFLEVKQLINFLYTIIKFKPSIVLIESSLDKKTVIRDAIHLFFGKVLKTRIAIHAHGGYWHLIPKWNFFIRRLSVYLVKKTDFLIVTSQEEYEDIKSLFAHSVNVFKIDNPVYFPFKASHKKQIQAPLKIIYASRFAENKGILDVLEAARLLKENANFEFKLFGKGELDEEVNSFVNQAKLSNIKVKGNIPLNELIQEYLEGDVYLFPSYHKEGFPMSLFFALGAGLPIIATKVRPLPNFLVEGVHCLWVDERNPVMLADKILELSQNPILMNQMREANIQTIKNFEPTKIVREYFELFEPKLLQR
ncbi:MAG: glycosyltransferase [Flavobacterium sp.]|nr:MAG: glycosyltransferase [Flavobacterium sp.]